MFTDVHRCSAHTELWYQCEADSLETLREVKSAGGLQKAACLWVESVQENPWWSSLTVMRSETQTVHNGCYCSRSQRNETIPYSSVKCVCVTASLLRCREIRSATRIRPHVKPTNLCTSNISSFQSQATAAPSFSRLSGSHHIKATPLLSEGAPFH